MPRSLCVGGPTPEGAWTGSFYGFPGGEAAPPSGGSLAIADGGRVLFGAGAYINTGNGGTVYALMPPASPYNERHGF